MLKAIAMTLTCLLAVSPALAADMPLGKWNTVDDKTGKVKSEVQPYDQGGKLYGKITGCPSRTTRRERCEEGSRVPGATTRRRWIEA